MMKKIKILSLLLIVVLVTTFAGCEIGDGMIWYDFEDENAFLGVTTDPKPIKPQDPGDDKDDNDDKNETVEPPVQSDEFFCQHSNLTLLVDLEATCTEDGLAHYECQDCGFDFEGEVITAKGHTEGEWVVEREPTLDSEGMKYTDCIECGERVVEAIPSLGYSEGFEFVSYGNGTCAILSIGSCSDKHISVPPTSPDGERVISIISGAFSGSDIVSVRLPETILEICDKAFAGSSVETVYLSYGIQTVGASAFADCQKLAEFSIPETVKFIGDNAFNSCYALSSLSLSEGLAEIGSFAFFGCDNLTFVNIPASVERIGVGAFSGRSIQVLTVASGNDYYEVRNNCLISSYGELLVGFGNCKIPSGVTIICNYAFEGNALLTEVSIPTSVYEIGSCAFANTPISEIIISSGVKSIRDQAFAGCQNLQAVTIHSTVGDIGAKVFEGCDSLGEILYYGTIDQWNSISIDWDNDVLLSVKVSFIEGVDPETVYGYGKTTISGNAAMIYELLEQATLADNPRATIKLDASDKITIDDFYLARLIFLSDHPECFWWGGNAIYYYNANNYLTSLELEYVYTGSELANKKRELENAVSDILANLPQGSVYDKALYLHNAVAERVTYEFTDNDQTPYGALVEGRAVCNGYATAYQLLLQRAGIRAWTVNGTAGGENHAWNVVWLAEDICVYTDVTWDDQGTVMHYYFNMSLDEIDDDHYTNKEFDLPECDHTEYSHIDVSADCNILYENENSGVLINFFGEEIDGKRIAQFYFVGDDFGTWLNKNGNKIYSTFGCSSISYSCLGNEYVVEIS